MAYYPHLVQLAWYTVEKLVSDWAKNPYYWEREIDIQSELRSRLSTVFSIIGYEDVIINEECQSCPQNIKTYRYSRVACEPSINYMYSDGKNYKAMPDIVVWDSLLDTYQEPGDNWPILWACEIKYKNPNPPNWDVEKLGYLLDQKRIKFGCWLIFEINESLESPRVSWNKLSHGKHLWKCTASAPSKQGTQ